MSLKAQVIIGGVLIIVLLYIINMVRKRELELKYVLPWLLCVIALLILVFVPGLMQGLADFLGIYSPVNMIFFLGFVFSMVIVYSLTLALSRVTAKMRRIAQVLALDTAANEEEKKDEDQKKEET